MKKVKFISVILIIIFSLLVLTACESEEENSIIQKNFAEMEYLENETLNIMKKYAEGYYRNDDNQIEWDKIEADFKYISSSVNVIIIDLTSLDIDSNQILELEKRVNNVNMAISEKNENNLLISISNLYSLVPTYISSYISDESLIKSKKIKSDILNSVVCSFINDYDSANNFILSVENNYSELIQNQEYIQENSYKVNTNYLKIQNLKMAIERQNIENIFQKYLETLTMFD